MVVDELKFDEIKTKNFKAVMDNLKVSKALVVLDDQRSEHGSFREKPSGG